MQESKSNKIFPIVLAALGTLYGVSPIDILPDVIPVAGWIDDLVITGGTILNLVQSYVKDSNKFFATIIGFIKWILWILGGILIELVGLLGATIYNLFN